MKNINTNFDTFKDKLLNSKLTDIEFIEEAGDACEDYQVLKFKLDNGKTLILKTQDYEGYQSFFEFNIE